MEYTNAQKLASVLSVWARPAISQIAASKLSSLAMIRNANSTLIQSGLVGNAYNITNELIPFIHNGVDTLLKPFLQMWLRKVPDEALPSLAHSICDTAMKNPKFSVLDGLIEFDDTDILELKDLLEKNLPISEVESYNVIK